MSIFKNRIKKLIESTSDTIKTPVVPKSNELKNKNLPENISNINKITTEESNTIQSYSQEINILSSTLLESQKLQHRSNEKLAQIYTDHQRDITEIKNAYQKQDKFLDKSFEVIDKGLETNNLELVSRGLIAGANVANSNPVEALHNKIDEAFDDDDVVIEL